MDTFVVIEFLVDKTVALMCKKWITKDVVNAYEVSWRVQGIGVFLGVNPSEKRNSKNKTKIYLRLT